VSFLFQRTFNRNITGLFIKEKPSPCNFWLARKRIRNCYELSLVALF